jgi:hypothetical protein
MIGRQFRLLLGPSDLDQIQNLIESLNAELLSDSLDADTDEFPPLSEVQRGGTDTSVFCLIAPLPRLGPIVLAQGSDKRPDIMRSYAIDFWRPFNDVGIIRAGRLYFVPSFYEGDREVRKGDDFVRWATRIFGKVKGSLQYNREWYAYVGPQASAMIKSGVIRVVP